MAAHNLSAWLPGKAPKWQAGLSQLLEAACYAQDLSRDAWDFAIEFDGLRAAGLTTNDVAWLTAKGYLDHEMHAAKPGSRQRRPAGRPVFADHSRFILTVSGLGFATHACRPPSLVTGRDPILSPGPVSELEPVSLPYWDRKSRKLWIGNTLIKQFKVPADNQELVLAAFDEEGWPPFIDDPLPPSAGINSKRRLHDTIIRLNRSHKHRLIRFHGNGNGLAVHWERVLSTRASRTRPPPKRR